MRAPASHLTVASTARLLADNPNEGVTEIATLCGFADRSHLSRAFLKMVGLTPTAWLHSRPESHQPSALNGH